MEEEVYTYKYPHPAVTTDCVIFGFDGTDLHILLIERGIDPYKGNWALPGGFMKMDETIEQCARRELKEETNLDNVYINQFYVFSEIHRDPRERVLTVAFYALVNNTNYQIVGGDDASNAVWFKWDELPPLAFDHGDIIKKAKEVLKRDLDSNYIAFRLLEDNFKMSQLQRLYELINGESYDRRNFQRKMLSSGLLKEEGICQLNTPHRPPLMYSWSKSK